MHLDSRMSLILMRLSQGCDLAVGQTLLIWLLHL